MLILACDPGVSGAFCRLANGAPVVFDMPTKLTDSGKRIPDRELTIAMLTTQNMLGAEVLLIEHVWGYEGQGGGAAFNFGWGAGGVEWAAAALGYRIEKVAAQRWKSAMKCPAEKKRAIDRATELFPAFVNLWAPVRGNGTEAQRSGRAEAALLAKYGELTLGVLA